MKYQIESRGVMDTRGLISIPKPITNPELPILETNISRLRGASLLHQSSNFIKFLAGRDGDR
jgi:hypothetical protein